MLEILQARLQQCMHWEIPDVQPGLSKSRGTRNQIAKIPWIIEKRREFEKNIYCASLTIWNTLTVNITAKWNVLKGMGISDHPTCLLRIFYAGQEAIVRMGHGTVDWFRIGKGVWKGCIWSPCLFNLYTEYITWNTWLD